MTALLIAIYLLAVTGVGFIALALCKAAKIADRALDETLGRNESEGPLGGPWSAK